MMNRILHGAAALRYPMKKTSIDARVLSNGFTTVIHHETIRTSYPNAIWKKVPVGVRPEIARTAAYFATRHLALSNPAELAYNFPPPMGRLVADYGFFYSMADASVEFPRKKLTTARVLQPVYNAEFSIAFRGIPPSTKTRTSFSIHPRSVTIPISFGKDSLLTFALSRELGLTPHPVFIEEPTCPYQNRKKRELSRQFNAEFSPGITRFPNALGSLRQSGDMMWGWDMLLAQYTMLLLPFVYANKSAHFFWSNEKSTNEHEVDRDGYIISPTHEQSVQWVLHLNNLYRAVGVPTVVSSLLEPIHELFILSILHKRYPDIGKYQLSCDGERTRYRWCGNCFECARVYIFFAALGIDPASVGLMGTMLAKSKKNLFYLFSDGDGPRSLDILFQSYPERLLAFYLAHKRGVKGELMDLFVKTLLPHTEKRKSKLFAKYFAIHEMQTIPPQLQPPLRRIYEEELARLKKEIT